MNDQPPHSASPNPASPNPASPNPASPNPEADPTAVLPVGLDPTAAPPPRAQPGSGYSASAQAGAAEWPAEPGPAWGSGQPHAAQPYGAPPVSPYGAEPAAPYGAPPAAVYGAPPVDPSGSQPPAPYGAGESFGGQQNAPYSAQAGAAYGGQGGPAYGGQAGQYPGFAAPGPPPPGSGGTSGFAIASLIFGVLGGILLSVIFGIVALVQIRKRGQTGRGMAIAGLTLSGCWLLLIIIGIAAAVISDSGNKSTSGTPGAVAVTQLKPGDCINSLQGLAAIEDLPVISCALPHEGEVYAVFELPAGPWPGDTAVQDQAEKRCNTELKAYAPKPAATVKVLYLHPLQQSWSKDRGVTCVATDERGTSVGSVRD